VADLAAAAAPKLRIAGRALVVRSNSPSLVILDPAAGVKGNEGGTKIDKLAIDWTTGTMSWSAGGSAADRLDMGNVTQSAFVAAANVLLTWGGTVVRG
jgi:hypothetical protein